MKIAILTSSFPLDPDDPAAAAGLFVRDFAVALAQQHCEVHVVTQDKGFGCKNPPDEIDVHCYGWGGGDKALSQLKLYNPFDLAKASQLIAGARKKLIRLHDQHNFDHVLAMWAVPAGLTASQLKSARNVPYSVWCLGSDIWTYGKIPVLRSIVAKVIRGASHRFADGMQLGEDASELSGQTIDFLPSSRKLPKLDFDALTLKGSTPRFLFVGRYSHVKGIDVLIKAFAHFRERHQSGSLYLLGGGPLRNSIVNQVEVHHLQDSVFVGGYANAETVVRYGKACDAFVIPSRNESIPVVLSDAVQLGKPVIVTDVGDMGKIVADTTSGIVVPPEDPESLAEALQTFAKSANLEFENGVKELSSRFDVSETAKIFLQKIKTINDSSEASLSLESVQ